MTDNGTLAVGTSWQMAAPHSSLLSSLESRVSRPVPVDHGSTPAVAESRDVESRDVSTLESRLSRSLRGLLDTGQLERGAWTLEAEE